MSQNPMCWQSGLLFFRLSWSHVCGCSHLTTSLDWRVHDGFTPCLSVGAGCLLWPGGDLSRRLNWASAQHGASQDFRIAKAEAARSLKVLVLKFTQHRFCHILLIKTSNKARPVSSGWKLVSIYWGKSSKATLQRGMDIGRQDSLGGVVMSHHRQLYTLH